MSNSGRGRESLEMRSMGVHVRDGPPPDQDQSSWFRRNKILILCLGGLAVLVAVGGVVASVVYQMPENKSLISGKFRLDSADQNFYKHMREIRLSETEAPLILTAAGDIVVEMRPEESLPWKITASKGELSSTKWEFQLGQEFTVKYGEMMDEGFLTVNCIKPEDSILRCRSVEEKRGLIFRNDFNFDEVSMVNYLTVESSDRESETMIYYNKISDDDDWSVPESQADTGGPLTQDSPIGQHGPGTGGGEQPSKPNNQGNGGRKGRPTNGIKFGPDGKWLITTKPDWLFEETGEVGWEDEKTISPITGVSGWLDMTTDESMIGALGWEDEQGDYRWEDLQGAHGWEDEQGDMNKGLKNDG